MWDIYGRDKKPGNVKRDLFDDQDGVAESWRRVQEKTREMPGLLDVCTIKPGMQVLARYPDRASRGILPSTLLNARSA